MKATDQIKHAAFEKTLDYRLEDPERNATKIMDMLDKVAPADLFPSQRITFRNAIDQQSNWYQLIALARAESRDAQRLHQTFPR